jgi:uncharacterized protein YndB with AHSA1/START domain
MSAKNKLVVTLPSDTEIALTRDFDAPRALVWEMFTKAEHIRQWWGHGFQDNDTIEFDARVGGTWRFIGRAKSGAVVPFRGEIREFVPPERVVYTEIFDVDVARDHPSLVTATFAEHGDKTRLHLVAKYDSQATRDMVLKSGMEHGAAASYDEVERMLGERSQVTITRELAAPRPLVWKAWTDPAQFAKWFGPRGFSIPRADFDVRAGGAIRYDMRAPNGMTMTSLGEFREVVEPERLVYTERSEHGGQVVFELLNTVTFAEQAGKTLLTLQLRVLRASPEMMRNLARAGEGWQQALDKLDELVRR